MSKQNIEESVESRVCFEELEDWVREKIQGWVQELLEEEVTELLGRRKSERRRAVDAPSGYRNGYGKPRHLTLSSGTIQVRRPRVRDLEEHFESRVLPLLAKRTRQVRELIPELYLHGLALGDFDLALRGLLGEKAHLSSSTVASLKEKWQAEWEVWQSRPLNDLEKLVAPDGSRGVYYYWGVGPWEPFSIAARSYTVLAASMPLLNDNLAFYVPAAALPFLQPELPSYRASRIPLVFDDDISPETGFLAMNPAEGYGRLQVMDPEDRPHPRNIVIYEALPNELPRVAGIVTTVPQTPLSHVNLRAMQDGILNAYIRDALDKPQIDALLGSYVRYEVTETDWDLRAATREEFDAHYASSRPARDQIPQRDLSVTTITPLSEIGFEDWTAFGVKAANVAVLGTLGFPSGTVPDGFAIPFYFYDEFMKAHGFYDDIKEMLANEDFQTDFDTQDDMLDDLRDDIKDAETPQWIIDALTAMHATFPEGQSLRYRSSTNNEDLPRFNGAGLYDSKTQNSDEEPLSKSLKQVFASLWTFRAFTEREFHRIDHLAAKMGVLVHPNYSDEMVNGVATSFDPFLGRDGSYYVNSQLGEDLVTNPDAHSAPEEILLNPLGDYTVLATSNQAPPGQLLMSGDQLDQLRRHLTVIHDHFKRLYNPTPGEPFAMEI